MRFQATFFLKEKGDAASGEASSILGEKLGIEQSTNLGNEILVLKSIGLMSQVVDSLGINVTYWREGNILDSEVYPNSPIELKEYEPKAMAYGRVLTAIPFDSNEFLVFSGAGDTLRATFGKPFILDGVSYRIDVNKSVFEKPLQIRIISPEKVALRYSNKISIASVRAERQATDVLSISLNDAIPQKSIDVIEELLKIYNDNEIREQRRSGESTLTFIDDRLNFITDELYAVERQVEGFKQERNLPIDISSSAANVLAQIESKDVKITEITLQQNLLDDIEAKVQKDTNYKLLPMVSSVIEGALSTLIGEYNALVLERENLLSIAPQQNPYTQDFLEKLGNLRDNILLNVLNIRRELDKQKAFIQEQLPPIEARINAFPTYQRELLQIMRQQQIKEQLFLFLLQRREETAIVLSAAVPGSRILNPARLTRKVAPNSVLIIGVAYDVGAFISRNDSFSSLFP